MRMYVCVFVFWKSLAVSGQSLQAAEARPGLDVEESRRRVTKKSGLVSMLRPEDASPVPCALRGP